MNEEKGVQGAHDAPDAEVGVLLVCFNGRKIAAKARHTLDNRLRSGGAVVLDTIVLQVDEHHHASIYDPRRVLAGTLTAAFTWGLFGVVTGSGPLGVVLSAILGAVLGGLYAYWHEHILTKEELVRIGTRLPAQSSALLTFAQTHDPSHLLEATDLPAMSLASVAAINADLSTTVYPSLTGPAAPVAESHNPPGRDDPSDESGSLNMILLRYPAPETARQVASRVATGGVQEGRTLQIELVGETDRNGRRHIADPTHGVATWAKSNVISWGGFGLVLGALAGAFAGGGIFGFLGGGLLTGIVWGLCGLLAGVLYGMWAGTAISARRLKGVSPLLPPGTSTLLAWVEGPVKRAMLDILTTPDARRFILRFHPVAGGAVLEAA